MTDAERARQQNIVQVAYGFAQSLLMSGRYSDQRYSRLTKEAFAYAEDFVTEADRRAPLHPPQPNAPSSMREQ